MRQIRATLSPAVLVPCPAFATKSSAPPQRHPTTNRSNYGNLTFAEILSRLRCQICRRRPSAVSLSELHPGDPGAMQGGQWTLVLVREGDKMPYKESRGALA